MPMSTNVSMEKRKTDEPAADQWIADVLPQLIQTYKPEDIYNCDETGIYYHAMPEGTLAETLESVSGSKKAKDRITALVCTNVTSMTDKHKLLVGCQFHSDMLLSHRC